MSGSPMEMKLKEASQMTGAHWAAWLELNSERWEIHAAYKLTKGQKQRLIKYLGSPPIYSWLNGSLAGKRDRSRIAPQEMQAQSRILHVFPDRVTPKLILVGAQKLSAESRRLWRLLALENQNHSSYQSATATEPSDVGLSIPYLFPQTLEKVLGIVLQNMICQGGWLAIRSGDVFEIKAVDKISIELNGERIPIEANPLMRRISQTRRSQIITREELEWAMVPRAGLKADSRSWIALPLVISQRVIGLIALWCDLPVKRGELMRLQKECTRMSPAVEASITFADITNHLRRMALLNDFALAVSSAMDLDQIAQRIFSLLQRTFETDRIILLVLSPDERTIHNYIFKEGKIVLQVESTNGNSSHWPVERGTVFRTENIESDSEYKTVYQDSRSVLLVPLMYRRQRVGTLGMESVQVGAFSIYDENMLVVIASHLSGLIVNGRLRQEAEIRARNLTLIHEVVEHIIGLTDFHQVAQITADLLTRNNAFEIAAVLLYSKPEDKLKLAGIAGGAADVVQQGLRYLDLSDQGGIISRVAFTGQSMLVNDVTQDPIYQPIPDWNAGSEMCVALREGERILGVIDVESQHKNAFTQSDLLLLEALAGILSNVISNVGQYQHLQATVNQLQAAREELQERIAAQRLTESRLVQAAKLVAVGEMAAGVAHELNNPLTTVSGFVELVMNELPKDSSMYNDLELVLREANRARGVVRRLLDFARQSESARVRTDLNEIVNDVLALVNHLLQTSRVEVTTKLSPHIPWVSVDRNQIKQVLLNLIHNALHAMPVGGELHIATEGGKRDRHEWLKIIVRDTGMGISPENLERVFEPFFTTRSKEGGTGLGLSVSYGIVSDHGGFIEADSEVGKGSVFTIWLPVELE